MQRAYGLCARFLALVLLATPSVGWAQDVGGEESVDELARELANPNTALASLNFKFQFRGYDGDLPEADSQNSAIMIFQPTLPFPLKNGATVFFRPAIPVLFSQPVFQPSLMDFDNKAGLGDTTFDIAYGRTSPTGILLAAGLVATVPTATRNELGHDRLTLGPEILIGKLDQKYIVGMFPNHQWDVAGSGSADISVTSVQFFGLYLPGGGWTVGTSPTITFDHIENEWTVPVNLTIGKTVIRGGRPWKLGLEINYYAEHPDTFSPEWMVGINVGPVVKNALVNLFR